MGEEAQDWCLKKKRKIKTLGKKLCFFVFFRKKTGKKEKHDFTPNYTYFMLLNNSFAMKLGYYPTLGLDFQTASKIAKYSAHPHIITNNEVITKET